MPPALQRLRWENFVEWAFYGLLAWTLNGLQKSVSDMSVSINNLNLQAAVSNRDQTMLAARITVLEEHMNDCNCSVQKTRIQALEEIIQDRRR